MKQANQVKQFNQAKHLVSSLTRVTSVKSLSVTQWLTDWRTSLLERLVTLKKSIHSKTGKPFWMCSRSVKPHLLRNDPVHKTLHSTFHAKILYNFSALNFSICFSTNTPIGVILINETYFWHLKGMLEGKGIPFTLFSTGNSSLQCWAPPYFSRCQYILAFTNEPWDIIPSSNSETRYLLETIFHWGRS